MWFRINVFMEFIFVAFVGLGSARTIRCGVVEGATGHTNTHKHTYTLEHTGTAGTFALH